MKNNHIIFIGSQNIGGLLDDGETMKNYMLSNALEKHGCLLHRIDVRNRPKRIYYLAKLFFLLVFARNYKIVMSSSPLVADSLLKVMKIFKWNGEKIYYWVIGGTYAKLCNEGTIGSEKYKDLHLIAVEGESMNIQLENEGFKNVMVLPNFKTIDYLPSLIKSKGKTSKFVFLSRVMPQKGVDYIIEASKKLEEQNINDFEVDIYGIIDPAYEEDFQNKIKNNKTVKYNGFLMLNENKGYDILASYDAMLFPTYWHGEGFPGIIIDAFISGLPVIASEWNLNTSLIKDKYNGMIIPVHNVDALASAMKGVITGEVDINTLSANAQKDVMKYDVDHVITKDLLKSLRII